MLVFMMTTAEVECNSKSKHQLSGRNSRWLFLYSVCVGFFCWPVCVRMCPWSSQGLEKAFPQTLHTHGSVCVLMCILSAPRLMYSFSQYLQLKYFLLLHSHWSCLCLVKPTKLKCSLWQSKHSNLSWLLQLEGAAGKIVTRGKEGGWRLSRLPLSPATWWISRFISAEDWEEHSW